MTCATSKKTSSMEIDDLKYEELQKFITQGAKGNMPEDLVQYLSMLELIRGMYAKYDSKAAIIKTLTSKTYCINERTAYRLIDDALNFFYSSNEVKKEAWRNIYAEKLENAAIVAWERNDMETYRRLIVSAAEMRGLNQPDPIKLPEEMYDRRPVIYVLDAKKLGLPQVSRQDLAAYIDGLPVPEKQKQLAKRDAMIEDAEFSIFPEDETDQAKQ
jgi:hypothetical protein